MIVSIDLPFPPSVNSLWKMGRSRTGKRIMYRTKRYISWLNEADVQWLIQKPKGRFPTIEGPFRLQILLSRPDRRSRDCDNLLKAPLDWAQHAGIISNDKNSLENRVGWATDEEAPMGMRLIIRTVS